MVDNEKIPAKTTGPPMLEAGTTKPLTFWTYLKGTTVNDPNVLGKELLEKALEFDEARLEQDSVKVRRKLDLIVLPMERMAVMMAASLR